MTHLPNQGFPRHRSRAYQTRECRDARFARCSSSGRRNSSPRRSLPNREDPRGAAHDHKAEARIHNSRSFKGAQMASPVETISLKLWAQALG